MNKNIVCHIIIVILGIIWAVYEKVQNDSIKMSTAIVFTVAWSIILIVHIVKDKSAENDVQE